MNSGGDLVFCLKTFREKAGLSQADLARISGIPQATISRLESGTIRNPSSSILQRLSKALDVSLDDLFSIQTIA
jgi:transcriptional regulator with XRE-family HTH domain